MRKQILGSIYVFLGAVLFSGKAVIVKWLYLHHNISTTSLLSLRMLFSLPFYIGILYWYQSRNTLNISNKQWPQLIFLGIVGYYLASYFDFWGLQYITASVERLVLFIYPTLVLIISAIFLGKKVTTTQYIALTVTYLGILVAYIPDLRMGASAQLVLGSILIFMSALTFAIYIAGSGQMIQKLGVTPFTSLSMIISTIMILMHHNLSSGHNIWQYSSSVYLWVLIMAVFCTVIPSYFMSVGIKMVGSNNSAIIGSVGPVSTIILAYIFLGEALNPWQLAGTALILAGVISITVKK
jgi:drug/metabolite transporter (DMT)-like permease